MTRIVWDLSTAYDLFVSLRVLHEPSVWQLRGAWAAGVRSRLSSENREFFKKHYDHIPIPVDWVLAHNLDDGAAVLDALATVSPGERLRTMATQTYHQPPLGQILDRVAAEGAFSDEDLAVTTKTLRRRRKITRKWARQLLDIWSDPATFGARLLPALREYYAEFFAEEEERIAGVLRHGLAQAQSLADSMPVQPLVEHLAQGVRFEMFPSASELVLAPSYWATPLIVSGPLADDRYFYLFGVRPPDASLVPGEVVPDSLYRALKALADPTRLRIMRYLSAEPHTPAQLARKLRLRPPTVVHHLRTLRVAGLVEITFTSDEKRRYAARNGAVGSATDALSRFLAHNGAHSASASD